MKVRIPVAPTTLVVRPRLLGLFAAAPVEHHPRPDLTFLCAPAGSGKTTLLLEWAQHRRRRADAAIAWVSLENSDNDIYAFWSAILAAIDASAKWADGSPVADLSAPSHGFSPAFLSDFVDAMDRTVLPVHLVLDDAHELYDPGVLYSLDLLLRSLPAGLRVIMSARFAPALALPRLRLEGRVREIDTTQLGFTPAEATALLGAHGVKLSPEDLQVLLDRTEGWAAGLRLAAMSLARSEDPAALIANFATNDRAVADYLVGEVLASQEDSIRQFLLDTSITDQITADLARELSGRADAGAVLDTLERSNSFILRFARRRDEGWYRYHPMLRDYLRAELARQDHDRAIALHRRAAHWYAARDQTLTAIEQAVQGADAELTATLLEGYGLQHVLSGEGLRLRRMLAQASGEVAQRPGVALVAAAIALEAGDLEEADAALALMRPGTPEMTASSRLKGLHEAIALHRARSGGDADPAREVLATGSSPTGDTDLDLLILLNRGATRLWLGQNDAAHADLQRALTMARATGRDWVALQCMAHLAAVAGARMAMAAAETLAREAIMFATTHGWTHSVPFASASLTLGWAAYQRLDDDTVASVRPDLRASLEDSPDPSASMAVAVFDIIVAFDRSDNRHELVGQMRDVWNRPAGHAMPALVAGAALIEQRMALQVGQPGWAGEVIERTLGLLGITGELHVLQAVAQAHRGRVDSARRLLLPVLSGELACVVPLTELEGWIWEARLADRGQDESRAHAALVQALTVSAAHGLLRPFLAGGQEVHDLLARGAGRFGRLETLASRVRSAFVPSDHENLERLTTRELELLVELPSLRTAEEIAASLFVSVNTVKTHLRGIYRKLGVNSRREAIVLARRRGLL